MGNLMQQLTDEELEEIEKRTIVENGFKMFENFVIHINRSQSQHRPYLITWEDYLGNHGSEILSKKEFNKKYN